MLSLFVLAACSSPKATTTTTTSKPPTTTVTTTTPPTTSPTTTPPTNTPPTTKPAPTLTSIALSPASPVTLAVGATRQFAASGNYTDGSSANVTAQVTWTSSNTTVAAISPAGLATGVAVGTANITASASGKTSPAVVVTVTSP